MHPTEPMEDGRIVELYWERDERAIAATSRKYGSYCRAIAMHILDAPEEAEECVNDTWWQAWNAMPPQRPSRLAVFLGKITRHLSIDRWRRSRADRRGGGEAALLCDELDECVSDGGSVEQEIDRRELAAAINAFLRGLPEKKRAMFVCRYWYGDSVTEIAKRLGMKPGAVATALGRIREECRVFLTERGF